MKQILKKTVIFLIVLFFSYSTKITAKNNFNINSNSKKVKSTENTQSKLSYTHFNINNISTFVFSNGETDINSNANSGLIFPKGSNKAAVYESGLVWGAIVNGEKRVGGSTYLSGLLPGRIIGSGATAVREDTSLASVRIYRVRRDISDGFASEIADGEGTADEIREQYEKDWNEWPAEFGAPFNDVDGDGNYNPNIDVPGIAGADQTIWYVANDMDTATCRSLYGSNPLGIEMQVTFWGYNSGEELGNTMFRKIKLINKSENTFDSMYVSVWADPDLGDANDDFVGCDTTLSLMYVYNGIPKDAVYGWNVPSIGFDFFQGPIVPSPGDTAIVDGKLKIDYKNLKMSSHYFFIGGAPVYADPDLGLYNNGTLQFYNLMEGKISSTGKPFIDPTTGKTTKFVLSGDPITETGWIDGILHSPGDRRQGMAAGPFNMAPGDTQEVVVALMAAFGDNRLDAITQLKNTDYYMQKVFDSNFSEYEIAPNPPKVSAHITQKNRIVTLSWGESSNIENFDTDGYKFQGYNIFQTNDKTQKLVKAFDIIDGVKTISQLEYDGSEGKEIMKDIQFGTDSGLEHQFVIEKDYINNSKLLKGKEYNFSVVAYTYNPDNSKRIKTSNSVREYISFKYRYDSYGFNYGEVFDIEHSEGNCDADIKVTVYDDDLITGDDYEISFPKEMYWNLKNTTTNEIVSENQQVYEKTFMYYHNYWQQSSLPESTIADGLEITVEGSFDSPITIMDVDKSEAYGTYRISDFKTFEWAETGHSIDAFGNGTTSSDELLKDYELRFTGEYETPDADGVIYVKDGTGSLATLYGARNYSLANHPMNPNPGTDAPFLVRIPFEVWNIDDNRQVNLLIYDRTQNIDDNPFYAFNPNDIIFCEINNTEYDESKVNSGNPKNNDTDSLTWNLIFEKTDWRNGDKVRIYYSNPIRIEKDKFTFKTLVEGKNSLKNYSLSQNYPNPFNPTTKIDFSIVNDGKVNLTVYDILGRKVTTLIDEQMELGKYTIDFNANNLASGVYIYRLSVNGFTKVKKMMLLK